MIFLNLYNKMTGTKVNADIKNVITKKEIKSKIATNQARIARSLRAIRQNKGNNDKSNDNKIIKNEVEDDIKNVFIKKKESNSNIVTNQGRSVRSTRATKQNNEGTSSSKSIGSDKNDNKNAEEEKEEEKESKKRKHFPVFEKNLNKKSKKFKKGHPLIIWSWNVAGLRANVKVIFQIKV
jgi:hypothetical protein